MGKINFKQIAMGAAGAAAGTFAANAINKIASKPNDKGEPLLNEELRGIAHIAVGAFAPGYLPKGEFSVGMGYALTSKGVDILLKKFVPSMVSGIDGFDGSPSYEGVGEVENTIAATPEEEEVAGTEENYVN